MRYMVTFCKPWSLSLFRAASLQKPKYQHVIPETGTNLGSHPDRYGCKTYLKLTVHWLGNSKVWMACYRGSENSFHSGKTGTEQWMGKAKCRDDGNGSGRSFSSLRSVDEFRKFCRMTVRASSLALVHTAGSRKSLAQRVAKTKMLQCPRPCTRSSPRSAPPAPASTFLLFDWTSLLLSL